MRALLFLPLCSSFPSVLLLSVQALLADEALASPLHLVNLRSSFQFSLDAECFFPNYVHDVSESLLESVVAQQGCRSLVAKLCPTLRPHGL